MIQIFLADGRTDGSSEVVQEVLTDLKRVESVDYGYPGSMGLSALI